MNLARPALALIAFPALLGAQDLERCVFPNTGSTGTTHFTMVQQPSGEYNRFAGGGVVGKCRGGDITIKADSLESFGDQKRLFLMNRVQYTEPRLALTSDKLTYHQMSERIVASEHVVAKLPTGSFMRGNFLDYYRAIPESRPYTQLIATQRPTFWLVQKDSTGVASDTLVVIADRVNMVGDSLVYASGNVVMTRPDVEARGDSVMIDSIKELMVLLRTPSIVGNKERPFTLTGVRIEMSTSNRKLSRVVAMGDGKAVSEDMTLTSDTIDLRVENNLLQRAIAHGPKRATARSPAQRIDADSIDVAMPGQRVREMHAVRGAVAEGQPDSTKFKADTVDWLRGDTIIARFDTAARKDSVRKAQLNELQARGASRSYYHMVPSDTTIHESAINYVTGRQIVVAFLQGRASKVTVTDKVSGVYLEPKPKPKPAATDTKSVVPVPTKPPE